MHEAIDEHFPELDEDAEFGDPGDHAIELVADPILHELGLEPLDDVTGRIVDDKVRQGAGAIGRRLAEFLKQGSA